LGKTVKYHVPNKQLHSHFFWCPLATVGHFDMNGKKICVMSDESDSECEEEPETDSESDTETDSDSLDSSDDNQFYSVNEGSAC
jgi:hypothetical protein